MTSSELESVLIKIVEFCNKENVPVEIVRGNTVGNINNKKVLCIIGDVVGNITNVAGSQCQILGDAVSGKK